MPVQRSSCFGIVRKTVVTKVLEGLSDLDTQILEEMRREDSSKGRVKNYVEIRAVVCIKRTEAKYMQNSGGKEALIVGPWATAAEEATLHDLRRKIDEYLEEKDSRLGSLPSSGRRSMGKDQGGSSSSLRSSVQEDTKLSKGHPLACGSAMRSMAGMKKPGCASTSRGRTFVGLDPRRMDPLDKAEPAEPTDDDFMGKPHVGLLSGVDRGLRLPRSPSIRKSELRALRNGGVKKTKRAGGPSMRSSMVSSETSAPKKAKKEEATEPVNNHAVTSTSRRDQTRRIAEAIVTFHSASNAPDDFLVLLYKIAGHALVCEPRDVMRCTDMDDGQFQRWAKRFYDWAADVLKEKERSAAEDTVGLFMGIPLPPRRLEIWEANWGALGGNQMDAHPRRASHLLADIEKPLGPLPQRNDSAARATCAAPTERNGDNQGAPSRNADVPGR